MLTCLVKIGGHKIKFLSEIMIAGYHKFLEGSIGDLSNSGIQAVVLMKRYGKDSLFIGAHSRGTLLVDNALRHLNTQENRDNKILSGTTIKMVGPAANVHKADQRLNQLQELDKYRTSAKGSLRVENHQGDLVGLIGRNPQTVNTNTTGKSMLRMAIEVLGFLSDSSSHNSYSLGQKQNIVDGYRVDKNDLYMHKEKTIYELEHPETQKKE